MNPAADPAPPQPPVFVLRQLLRIGLSRAPMPELDVRGVALNQLPSAIAAAIVLALYAVAEWQAAAANVWLWVGTNWWRPTAGRSGSAARPGWEAPSPSRSPRSREAARRPPPTGTTERQHAAEAAPQKSFFRVTVRTTGIPAVSAYSGVTVRFSDCVASHSLFTLSSTL